jgi:hypothetical protein
MWLSSNWIVLFWAETGRNPGLAAHRAGLHGRSLAMAVVAGLLVSGIVLALPVILEPGKAAQHGAAAAIAQLN